MQRQLLAAAARAARAPATRSTVQRRFASTTDNAFIREREAAKHHAAGTTGSFSVAFISYPSIAYPVCETPTQEFLSASDYEHIGIGRETHVTLSERGVWFRGSIRQEILRPDRNADEMFLCTAPASRPWPRRRQRLRPLERALGALEPPPPLEERVEYSYQNIRTKNYQWGNGDKTIFWNDNVNYHNKDKA
ncbi:putative cytochrome c oxidase subunit VIa [Colletotrichum higginsianum]|nr:putative cytochrome c oxidase subunit VIa [Colletotrichum higginsianum]